MFVTVDSLVVAMVVWLVVWLVDKMEIATAEMWDKKMVECLVDKMVDWLVANLAVM